MKLKKILDLNLIVFIAVLTFIFLTFNLSKTQAASIKLGVYPPIIQINATPPAKVSADIQIQNQNEESTNLKIIIKPFKPKGTENGELSYLFNDNEFGTDPLMRQRIKIYDQDNEINSIILSPKQEKNLKLEIDLPKGETPSDYYFSVIFVSDTMLEEDKLSQNAAGIATNVLLSVGPKVKPKGEIVEFSVPFFLEKGPAPFKVKVRNESDFFITPKATIIIKNVFGQSVGRIDLLPVNILAHSTRTIPSTENSRILTADWNESFLLGPYTATLIVALSDQGPLFKRDIHFIGFPVQILIGLVLASLIIAIITNKLRKKLKK
ncbi:MAG: hypothetical protein V1697_02950 [Candidatus Levyibacteriota bacterium]